MRPRKKFKDFIFKQMEEPEYFGDYDREFREEAKQKAEEAGMKRTDSLENYIDKYCGQLSDPEYKKWIVHDIMDDYIKLNGAKQSGMIFPEKDEKQYQLLMKVNEESDLEGMIKKEVIDKAQEFGFEISEEAVKDTLKWVYEEEKCHRMEFENGADKWEEYKNHIGNYHSQYGDFRLLENYFYDMKYKNVPLYEQPVYNGQLGLEKITEDITAHGLDATKEIIEKVALYCHETKEPGGIDDMVALYQKYIESGDSLDMFLFSLPSSHSIDWSKSADIAINFCYDNLVKKASVENIVKELRVHGFEATRNLVENLRKLNDLERKNLSLKDVHRLETEVFENDTMDEVVEELRGQELEKLQMPAVEM